jgi:hypothetical protein
MAALSNGVPHFRRHSHSIIHITRLQLGDAYQLAWEPKTKVEGLAQ